MSKFWSSIVETLVPYTPGEQPKRQQFIKLNTNENPYGPSPRVLEALTAASGDELRLYPDPSALDLRQEISGTYGLSPDHVFAGNGSDEVLAHSFLAFFSDKAPILFPDITYAFYKTYCRIYRIQHHLIALGKDYRWNPANFSKPCGGVVLANPNAPTGIAVSLEDIEYVLKQNPEVVVLVDEAYVDFGALSAASLVPHYENLLVVQTFSKSRSLAGLRVGFALGQPHLIEALMRVKDSFNSYPLGRLSLVGALEAWRDQTWFEETRSRVMQDRECLRDGLVQRGFVVLPSAANFLFVSHLSLSATHLSEELRTRGILVRHFSQKRIDNWLRISIGTTAECKALVSAIDEILIATT